MSTRAAAAGKRAEHEPQIPEKPRLTVREAAALVAGHLGIREQAALHRLYRRIGDGSIQAQRYVGTVMIPRSEIVRILRGDPV